jgi:hypothetical protein
MYAEGTVITLCNAAEGAAAALFDNIHVSLQADESACVAAATSDTGVLIGLH